MKPTAVSKINRNTAILATSLVENSCRNLTRDEVPVGAAVWGFDPTDPANEPQVFAADDPGTREWTQHTTEPFNLRSWVAKKIELTDPETGTVSTAVRTSIFDNEGESMTFVSVGIIASLDLFRTLRGDGPYEPPIPVVVSQVKTRSGFSTLKLRPVQTGQGNKSKKS